MTGKLRVLLTAERLLAERGFQGVSMREIAAAAGNRNNNAVKYHFGSMEGLIDAIMRYRLGQLDKHRGAAWQDLQARGSPPTLEDLLAAYFLPHVLLADPVNGYPYADFMTEFLTRHRPRGLPHAAEKPIAEAVEARKIMSAFRSLLSGLDDEMYWHRFELIHLLFFGTILRWSGGPHRSDLAKLSEMADHTLGMMRACLEEPAPSVRKRAAAA